MSETPTGFSPARHFIMINGKGGSKQYLPIAARIAWFREKCPIEDGWGISTERIAGGRDEKYSTYRATILDPAGRILATATKTEDIQGFPDYDEKAETSAIGRALAMCGFGTLFAQELDEGTERIVDSPAAGREERPTPNAPAAGDDRCSDCGVPMTGAQITLSQKHFQKNVCPNCRSKAGGR